MPGFVASERNPRNEHSTAYPLCRKRRRSVGVSGSTGRALLQTQTRIENDRAVVTTGTRYTLEMLGQFVRRWCAGRVADVARKPAPRRLDGNDRHRCGSHFAQKQSISLPPWSRVVATWTQPNARPM